MVNETCDSEPGKPRRKSKGQAPVPEQGRGDCLPHSGFAEQGVVAEVDQHGLW